MTGRETAAGPPSWQRRALVLLVWALVLLGGGLQITRTHFSADLSAFLPKSPDVRQQVLIEQLQSGVASRTLLLGIEGGASVEQRAAVSRAVAKAMRESQLFDLIQNGDTGDWTKPAPGSSITATSSRRASGPSSSPSTDCATPSMKRCRCWARPPAT